MLDYSDKEQGERKIKCTIWREKKHAETSGYNKAYARREGIIVMKVSTIEERLPALHWNETRGSTVQDPSQLIKSEEVLGSLSIVSESC